MELIRVRVFWSDPDSGILFGSGSRYLSRIRIHVFCSDPDPCIWVGAGSRYFVRIRTLVFGSYPDPVFWSDPDPGIWVVSGSGYFGRIRIKARIWFFHMVRSGCRFGLNIQIEITRSRSRTPLKCFATEFFIRK